MASEQELSAFLLSVEKRAFKQAVFAVRDDDAALDIVQRILQNTIYDWFRRTKVRNTWISLFSSFRSDAEGDDTDPLELIESEAGSIASESSADKFERTQMLGILEREIEKLPARQREAFLMRYWEDMDVAETAQAMGCSEGSVKTHCSRATHALAQALRARGIRL
jgi:RNA polymerase sigma-70 factor (ECF subfamily)